MKQGDSTTVTYEVHLVSGVLRTNSFIITIGSRALGRPRKNTKRDLSIIACVTENIEGGYSVEDACRITAETLSAGSCCNHQDNLSFRRIQQIYQERNKSSEE